MTQYDKLINLGLLSQFLTKAKTIFAPKITASGILKGDGAGNVSAATVGTDYLAPSALTPYRTAAAQDVIDAGKEVAGLGLTGASVGDLVQVNSVDSNGRPTSWKHVTQDDVTRMLVKANELGIIVNGKKATRSASTGQYIILRNSTISGKTDGLYTASKAIPANTAIDSTYLGNQIAAGGLNNIFDMLVPKNVTYSFNSTYIRSGSLHIKRIGKLLSVNGYFDAKTDIPMDAVIGTVDVNSNYCSWTGVGNTSTKTKQYVCRGKVENGQIIADSIIDYAGGYYSIGCIGIIK